MDSDLEITFCSEDIIVESRARSCAVSRCIHKCLSFIERGHTHIHKRKISLNKHCTNEESQFHTGIGQLDELTYCHDIERKNSISIQSITTRVWSRTKKVINCHLNACSRRKSLFFNRTLNRMLPLDRI